MKLGFVEENYRKNAFFCAYKHCPWAAQNKAHKCGEESVRKQAPRAKCQSFCMHPLCMRPFHATCHAIVHRLVSPEKVLVPGGL